MSAARISPRRRGEESPEPCLVAGCGALSIRHLALAEAQKGLPGLPKKGHRAPVCRDHYREWKKATRPARVLDRLGW